MKKLFSKSKVIAFCLLVVLMVVGLTGCKTKNDKVIRVGTNAEFPPFEYMDENGKPTGFDIELITAICNEMGYEVEIVNMEFKSLIASIQTGGIDASIAGMTVTEERKQSVNFSESYFNATQYIILPIDSSITDIAQLNGKRIAVQEGTTGDLIATPGTEDSMITDTSTVIKRFKKGTDAVLELKNGGVDAVIIDSSPAKKFVSSNTKTLKYIDTNMDAEEYAIAVSKDKNEILDIINEGLIKVKENGTYDALIEQYFGEGDVVIRKTSDNWFINLWYTFEFVFISNGGYKLILSGLGTTLLISVCAVLLGVVLGMVLAFMKLTEEKKHKKTLLSRIASLYIDIIRGTPVIVQLLIMYMIVFQNRIGVVAAIVTFGMNSAAYVAEIIRAGIMAVDHGQMEGGRSLGFTYGQTMRFIILPQAIKNILPALCNEFIVLIKETSVVGYVAVQDLTKASDFIISRTYETFIPLITIALIYYVIVKVLSKVFAAFERRLRKSDKR
ncbi:MAG: transporter substrate-binding domain-containing protein [Lachnospira sp.]|nr:transporter substrate-binding domain-containing protein [Lachnospira sp.]